jgi:DNA processing protein
VANPTWVALSLTPHLGGKTLRTLLRHYSHNLDAILAAESDDLRRVPGIGPRIAAAIRSIDLNVTARQIQRWEQAGVRILTRDDPKYPATLRALDDAPPTLFIRGDWPDWKDRRAFAVVGTRHPTPESREIAGRIGAELAEMGHITISGLASGIDHAAHMAAVAVSGSAVAVLGSGVLNIYPPSSRELAQAVIKCGALVCEVAPDASVSTPGLVARNRIISGLADGLIVVESGVDGGAMHAARFARIQGRPVYAVDNDASGNRHLIDTAGAILISPHFDTLRTIL